MRLISLFTPGVLVWNPCGIAVYVPTMGGNDAWQVFVWLSQWPTGLNFFGVTDLGKIKFGPLFHSPKWLNKLLRDSDEGLDSKSEQFFLKYQHRRQIAWTRHMCFHSSFPNGETKTVSIYRIYLLFMVTKVKYYFKESESESFEKIQHDFFSQGRCRKMQSWKVSAKSAIPKLPILSRNFCFEAHRIPTTQKLEKLPLLHAFSKREKHSPPNISPQNSKRDLLRPAGRTLW